MTHFDAADAAVEAAIAAGATYADARVMHRRFESMSARNGDIEDLTQRETAGIGVRALVGGSWGFFAVPDLDAAVEVANRRAPEHVEVLTRDPWPVARRIRHAGAIFVGASSPEPVGDYLAGPSHVLPTGATARYVSPLGVYDFVKRISVIAYSRRQLEQDAAHIIALAEAEGLPGHAEAVRIRMSQV